MESRDVMNIRVVEHSILNGIEYCTFWFRSVVEMTRHQLLLHFALKIRSGGNVTPKAPIYLIAVIHSCLPLIFLNAVVSPLLISTFEGKVVPRAKPASSTLKIASEG
jgi:hypothetical protein